MSTCHGDRRPSLGRNYRRLVAFFANALFLATFPLWIPQDAFPRVPAIGILRGAPDWPLYPALLAMLAGLVGLARHTLSRKWALLLPLGWLVEVAFNQHALQPWAYQFVIVSLLFITLSERRAIRFSRILIISIYSWSALSKFDFQFIHTVGSQMIATMLKMIGIAETSVSHETVSTLAFSLPAVELIVAILLVFARTRRWGVVLAITMHLAIASILSPWGLGHEPGVLLWNVFFAMQAYVLYWPSPAKSESSEELQLAAPSGGIERLKPAVTAVFAGVLLFPATERAGICDHWPAWALYAPHSSRVRMEIPAGLAERLPPALRPPIDNAATMAWEWVEVPLSQGSIESLSAPIYPQARFQLGVAIAVAKKAHLQRDVRFTLRDASNRWTGLREERQLVGIEAAEQAAGEYWLNAQPK